MNASSAARDSNEAVGGVVTGAVQIQGAEPLADGATASDREAQAPFQINVPSTTVNGSIRTQIF